ncbi:MAG: GatB/YqeY domain-containing protein [Chlorobi bacterium]|nr:GatB/YqeY domain-containing protein [Chlorobiota bacterium]
MSLNERIVADLKEAMKTKDKIRIDTLRSIRAQILEYEKSGKGAIAEEEELKILLSAAKKRKEAIEQFQQGGRDDLVAVEQAELEVIQQYLPEQMDEASIRQTVKEHIERLGVTDIKDMGKVMGSLMTELRGKADGKLVQQIVKELLTGGA